MKDRLLRPDQLAERLGISRSQAYRLIAAGHFDALMPGHRSVQVTEASVNAYIERRIGMYKLENG
jgi:excisionase family DNA binding protein